VPDLTITPYERRHQQTVLELLFYSRRTHTHLDWYKPATWIESFPSGVWLAWEHTHLVGCMAAAPVLNGTSWLRLAALDNAADAAEVLVPLWEAVCEGLRQEGTVRVYLLMLHLWLEELLPLMGLSPHEDVVTLYRNSLALPPTAQLRSLSTAVRDAYLEDTALLTEIDHAAFRPPWQMPIEDMRQALRQAATATIISWEGESVGYQISTRHQTSGHLARIAVLPTMQGRGLGAALLDETLRRFLRRGVRAITVNTQASNTQSQRLYERYDFRRNGFDLRVYSMDLTTLPGNEFPGS
jgi:ribosomal protein S18 acetylase RimI-like enzyme